MHLLRYSVALAVKLGLLRNSGPQDLCELRKSEGIECLSQTILASYLSADNILITASARIVHTDDMEYAIY